MWYTRPAMPEPFVWRGFSSPTYTQVPDELFDELAPRLTDSELRICLYVIRRTFGFKRDTDDISLRQMVDGLRAPDGRRLDHGTGLSKSAVARALTGLVSTYLALMMLAVAQTYVVYAGDIDLSAGAIVSLVNVVIVVLMERWGGGGAAVLGALAVGLVAGLVSGAAMLPYTVSRKRIRRGMVRLQPALSTS